MNIATADRPGREPTEAAHVPRTAALAVCALAAVAFALLGANDDDDRGRSPAPVSLRPAATQCADLDDPARRAVELEQRAEAKMARYAFVPGDGIAALDLLAEATRCREHAGDVGGAQQTRAHLEAWLGRIDRDFSDHRLRLERARRNERHADALLECRALLALFATRNDLYVAWLRRLSFELESAVEPVEEP